MTIYKIPETALRTYHHYTDDELLVFLCEGNTRGFEDNAPVDLVQIVWVSLSPDRNPRRSGRTGARLIRTALESPEQVAIRHLSTYLVVSIKYLATNYIKSQITHRKYQEHLILTELHHSLATDQAVQFTDLSKAVEEAMKEATRKVGGNFQTQPLRKPVGARYCPPDEPD